MFHQQNRILVPKSNVEEYKKDEINQLLDDKVSCRVCKFAEVYTGKKPITFPRNIIYRLYCKMLRIAEPELHPVWKRRGDIFVRWKKLKGIQFYLPSVLLVKEMRNCPVDLAYEKYYRNLQRTKEEQKLIKEWKGKPRKIYVIS